MIRVYPIKVYKITVNTLIEYGDIDSFNRCTFFNNFKFILLILVLILACAIFLLLVVTLSGNGINEAKNHHFFYQY